MELLAESLEALNTVEQCTESLMSLTQHYTKTQRQIKERIARLAGCTVGLSSLREWVRWASSRLSEIDVSTCSSGVDGATQTSLPLPSLDQRTVATQYEGGCAVLQPGVTTDTLPALPCDNTVQVQERKRQRQRRRRSPSLFEPALPSLSLSVSSTPVQSTTNSAGNVPQTADVRIETAVPGVENLTWARVVGRRQPARQEAKSTVVPPAQAILRQRGARRPAAILLEAPQGDYARVLRNMKASAALSGVGADVTRIRKTKAGKLLVEFRRGAVGVVEDHGRALSRELGASVVVSPRVPSAEVVVRDLDETTTTEDVAAAFTELLGTVVQPVAIRALRPAYGGTMTAVIRLPVSLAQRAIAVGKVRIGWVWGRIRAAIDRPLRCFRCWGNGHLAQHCRSAMDRSNDCFRCGESGHKASQCTVEREVAGGATLPVPQ